jgi:carboxylate-amine ligase
VVLIAGLFRAVVARELASHRRGRPAPAIPAPLQRAAMWRAARSGLEGELVDLGAQRSLPASLVVRGMVAELRPELEEVGDWEAVLELAETALAAESAAARQREALRRRESFKDVVDLIVAETKGERSMPPVGNGTSPIARGYRAPGYDEAIFPDGRAKPSHARILELLSELGGAGMRERAAELERVTLEAGVIFRTTEAKRASAFPIDIVPRVLTGEEWSRLQGGTAQRARALDAFLNDVYGECRIVRDGVVPASLIEAAPGRRPAGSAPPQGARRAQVSGFDIARDPDGRWLVLEDNVRIPSGLGYAIEARRLSKSVFPELGGDPTLLNPNTAPALLRRTLEESAPPEARGGTPGLVVLSDGDQDSAYFEHELLAREMDVPLATPADLFVQDDVLYLSKNSTKKRVDVVYLRIDDALAWRKGADGRVLGPELVRCVRRGTLTLANALGNGVADDRAVYEYVPRFIEYYLGEIPLLEQVPTYHCADPDLKRQVLSRIDQLVLKPVDGYGGLGVVVGPLASDRELAEVERLIREDPARWIAEESVALSTHPTHHQGRLEPRHVDLRVFVYYGAEPVVVPAALTRVAARGSMVVNSPRGGGAKDTWLVQ